MDFRRKRDLLFISLNKIRPTPTSTGFRLYTSYVLRSLFHCGLRGRLNAPARYFLRTLCRKISLTLTRTGNTYCLISFLPTCRLHSLSPTSGVCDWALLRTRQLKYAHKTRPYVRYSFSRFPRIGLIPFSDSRGRLSLQS